MLCRNPCPNALFFHWMAQVTNSYTNCCIWVEKGLFYLLFNIFSDLEWWNKWTSLIGWIIFPGEPISRQEMLSQVTKIDWKNFRWVQFTIFIQMLDNQSIKTTWDVRLWFLTDFGKSTLFYPLKLRFLTWKCPNRSK